MPQETSQGYRLLHRDLSEVFYPDLVEFLALKLRETQLYDYKRDFPTDGAKLAKTIAAFANLTGGVLLIGVAQDEVTGAPSDIIGVEGHENALLERVQQIALRHIFPALPIQSRAIRIPDGQPGAGRRVVIARVHQSPQAPHYMVDTNAIYVRTGDSTHPEGFPELRWLEYLLERRRGSELVRKQLWDESVAIAEAYASDQASKSVWWFTFASSPTYPYGELKPERKVREIMTAALEAEAIPCPGGALRRNPLPGESGKGIEFIRVHQFGFVFLTWALPSLLETDSPDWLAIVLSRAWKLGADVLRSLEWSGHVTVRAELNNVSGRAIDSKLAMRSAVNRVLVEEQVLAPEMLDPAHGVAAAARVLDRLIWGMGHVGYGIQEAERSITQKLSELQH